MKYYVSYKQFDGKEKPLLLTKTATTEELKFYLSLFEEAEDKALTRNGLRFELLSIVPCKEV